MKIKVHQEKPKEWGPTRQGIFWAAFCVLLALAVFEAGWIVRDFQKDDLRDQVYRLDQRQKDLSGRLIAIEGKKK